MAITFVVGSFLASLPLSKRPNTPNLGPVAPLSLVTFEVFEAAATGDSAELTFADPDTGTLLPVKTRIITAADVVTVQLIPRQTEDIPFHPWRSSSVRLAETSSCKVQQKLKEAEQWSSPMGRFLPHPEYGRPSVKFHVTGGRIDKESEKSSIQATYRQVTRHSRNGWVLAERRIG